MEFLISAASGRCNESDLVWFQIYLRETYKKLLINMAYLKHKEEYHKHAPFRFIQ